MTFINNFLNSPDHEKVMTKIKKAVENYIHLSPFDPTKDSFVFTDAATNGLGYILFQKESVKVNQEGTVIWSIIACGSCSLTPAQTRYSIYDLELSAIAFTCIKLLAASFLLYTWIIKVCREWKAEICLL